jgi:hypothetical protein
LGKKSEGWGGGSGLWLPALERDTVEALALRVWARDWLPTVLLLLLKSGCAGPSGGLDTHVGTSSCGDHRERGGE